jgi:hypothetical protein
MEKKQVTSRSTKSYLYNISIIYSKVKSCIVISDNESSENSFLLKFNVSFFNSVTELHAAICVPFSFQFQNNPNRLIKRKTDSFQNILLSFPFNHHHHRTCMNIAFNTPKITPSSSLKHQETKVQKAIKLLKRNIIFRKRSKPFIFTAAHLFCASVQIFPYIL